MSIATAKAGQGWVHEPERRGLDAYRR